MIANALAPPENYLVESIIKLQLKKPKNWNWQLSTSKSSPHISLPIIQLYDAKGQLILKTKDSGGISNGQRKSWHSRDVEPPGKETTATNVKREYKVPRHLQRCRSDTLDQNNETTTSSIPVNSKQTIPAQKTTKQNHLRRDDDGGESKHQLINYELNKCSSSILDYAISNRRRRRARNNVYERSDTGAVFSREKNKKLQECENDGNSIREDENEKDEEEDLKHKRNLHDLNKSKSEAGIVFEGGNSDAGLFDRSWKWNSMGPLLLPSPRSIPDSKNEHRQQHRRSKSDDVFHRKLKFNEESLKRAETDGYKKFLTSSPARKSPEKISSSRPSRNRANFDKNAEIMEHDGLLLNNNNIQINHFRHNRYKTRTSSAGTLIISEESFNNNNSQRRRRHRDASIENSNNAQNNAGLVFNAAATAGKEENVKSIIRTKATSSHVRQVSDPTHLQSKEKSKRNQSTALCSSNKIAGNRLQEIAEAEKPQPSPITKNQLTTETSGLFYSLSDIFPFKITSEKELKPVNNNNNNNSIEIEKSPSSSLLLNKKKRRKISRHSNSDASTSSSALEKENQHRRRSNSRRRMGDNNKARVVKEHQKDNGGGIVRSGDSDLLHQLVRRLSTNNDHVKMGANVSRHSSKGLSGRRSQSSGSICNGKGRQQQNNDGKMCGSLPSYLDDRNSTGCNNNHQDCEKPPLDEVQRIPPLGDGATLHWKFSDNQTVLCDQGYGSERSPEEEYPPPLPDHDSQCHHHLEPHACYPFITPESTFVVKLTKSSRGLGLSVTGGIDSGGSWPGLIRIKRLFPHQPASACGLLNVGDLIIEANGITLTGLTNYEALEVLRTAPNQVDLKVCRPPPDVLSCVSPISEVPPPPPRREPPSSLSLTPPVYSTPEDDYYHGEFEVTLTKIQGSLGFTLRKEDDSALGHYVRALVREPALTDGRIRAGDKIIAVNEVEISPMTHEQAVQFLRQCGDVVKLRLYRDSAQTPVAALSPTETTPRTSFSKKTHLRQEAVDMLNDIAVRKLIPSGVQQETYRRTSSPQSSPRRLRRPTCPSDASSQVASTDSSMKYLINDEQFHEGLLQQCSSSHHPFDDENFSLFTIDPEDDDDRPSRPSSLDLYNPNQTPVAARKPRFNFSLAHNAYELNNLDPEVLDAPNLTYNLGNDDVKSTEVECGDSFPQEPASMPHIPIDNPGFSYKNPAYQSAHPQCSTEIEETKTTGAAAAAATTTNKMKIDENSMKKWKGVVFDNDEEEAALSMPIQSEYEILAIELNRGWNSRLGFSLQGAAGVTYVSAVHADSVAAKDGRLKPGDRVIKVNDESVEHLSTNEIIDLLRIVRGPVCIVVSRIKSKEDCPSKSNAEN